MSAGRRSARASRSPGRSTKATCDSSFGRPIRARSGSSPSRRRTGRGCEMPFARVGGSPQVLNLFGYTGAMTLSAAAAGASVTHVDGSRPTVAWARRNAELSGLADRPVRWIVDDVERFVAREQRRERRYDAVDPRSAELRPRRPRRRQRLATRGAPRGPAGTLRRPDRRRSGPRRPHRPHAGLRARPPCRRARDRVRALARAT